MTVTLYENIFTLEQTTLQSSTFGLLTCGYFEKLNVKNLSTILKIKLSRQIYNIEINFLKAATEKS